MTTSRQGARGTLDSRHLSALRWRLLGALAVGCALAGCSDGTKPLPRPVFTAPEPVDDGPCPFGDAGVACYTLEELEYSVQSYAPLREVTYTADGCMDPGSASFARLGCGPYAVTEGERREGECCYYTCYASPGCGRPFVVGGEARVARAHPGGGWVRRGSAPAASDERAARDIDAAIAREWLRDALAEHASIASFSAFNLSLLALGAPAELVRAGAAAALDEVHHARACFELASHYAGAPVGPGALDLGALRVETDLVAVTVRTFLDGCIGETASALVARASADVCDSPRVRAVLERIADDESRHAELAWQLVAWALARGGDDVARALSRALETALAELDASDCRASERPPPEWHAAGRLSEAERARISEQALHQVVRPLLEELLSAAARGRSERRDAMAVTMA